MRSSVYFQPMQHRPLPDIRKYALVTNQQSEFYAVVKPGGIDVYINSGKIYDMNHNELQNEYLAFHFEKLLKVSLDNKLTALGTLVSPDLTSLLQCRHALYNKTKSPFTSLKFIVYDVVFPVFNTDHIYKWRYDIANKVVGSLPNCGTASKGTVKDEIELQKFVAEIFSIDSSTTILVYKLEGEFVPGPSQLYYDDVETVSYKIEANQRYRAHIKRVVSTTVRLENGDKTEVALMIIARFKKENIEIPINQSNRVLCKFIWDNRHSLKDSSFWFTGYTIQDRRDNNIVYITIINEFLSFIHNIT